MSDETVPSSVLGGPGAGSGHPRVGETAETRTGPRRLHEDWPEFDPATEYHWDLPDPYSDITSALDLTLPRAAAPLGEQLESFTLADVRSVERYDIDSNDGKFSRANRSVGSELDMVMVGELLDGRWFAITAGNDYTGWGCMGDTADIKVGTRDDVIRYGLDNEGRTRLGFAAEVTS